MGIKGLNALLSEHAPKAMKEHEIKTLFGRKVAIDASMSIYQFLVAVRQKDGTMLMNENGDVTSHLMGFFFRTIRMVDQGIKPMYVFDGKPPELKGGVLAKRFGARAEAAEQEAEAKEVGTAEDIDKLARRQVKPTKQHNEECRRLLTLMGIPVVVAPGEAEAQCAELARAGKVYAAGSEDMDTITFNAPILLRHLTFSEAKKQPIQEIDLKKVLEELEMTMERFIELCLLLGCDYLEPGKGIGPKTALKLMREHGTLAAVVDFIRGKMADKEAAAEEVELVDNAGSAVDSDEDEERLGSMNGKDESDDVADLMDDIESEDGRPAPSRQKQGKSSPVKGQDDADDADSDVEAKKPISVAADSDSEDDVKPRAKKIAKAKATPEKKDTQAKAKPTKAPIKKKTVKGGMSLPEHWPWEAAKELFMHPDVQKGDEMELEWKKCDIDGLVDFLVREKGFNEDRVRNGAAKLDKMLAAKQQGRLDGFFKVMQPPPGSAAGKAGSGSKGASGRAGAAKRKGDEKEKAGAKKAKGKK